MLSVGWNPTGFAYIRNQIFYTLKFLCEEATSRCEFAKLAENEVLQNILMLKSLILVLKVRMHRNHSLQLIE